MIKRRRRIYFFIYLGVWIVSIPLSLLVSMWVVSVPDIFYYVFLGFVVIAGIIAALMEVCCIGICSLSSGNPSRGGLLGFICLVFSYFVFGWIICAIANFSENVFGKIVGIC